ncbi:MAG TPA: GNAT family N-acetyltransferase [candidate division Zixibacteria bacterium]|nr:GNAT family N-acetyltransferase [candidate division Zixibacteria bacterium]
MRPLRPRYVPVPSQDAPEGGRLILRDGTTASLRIARPEDKPGLAEFFAGLSNRSRVYRFFSASEPAEKVIETFCDNSAPDKRLTLVVTRAAGDRQRIVAAGTYAARDEATAEVAMAVDDRLQGKGIGSLLLERLALLAAANGFRRLWAVTMHENKAMLDVFRDSGFECRTRMDQGYVEIDLSLVPTETSVMRAELRDRVSTTASLRPFFQPRSVVLVGASRKPGSIGDRILKAIEAAGFRGSVYLVNPTADFIGSRKVYPSVRELPEAPDLAIITVPAQAVLGVIDDCAARGVRAALVISAGFAEIGREGARLQEQLVEKVRGYGMRLVGPNCLGLMNTDPAVRLNASFSPIFPPAGRVAFSSQSGALGLAIITLARERGLGLSKFISVGNKADVSGNDLLQYWDEDPQTAVILLYLESFGNPRRFARIARRVGRHKPIVALKAGRTGAGLRAASSHTAALAASEVAVDALCHQAGVIRVDTIDEMFDVAAALDAQPLPPGRRVGILTNAGGLGILCADSCEANGLAVEPLQPATRERLASFLPPTAAVANPVDMIASAGAEEFRKATEILLGAEEIDALIVLTIDAGLASLESITAAICAGVRESRAGKGAGKTVLACVMGEEIRRRPLSMDGERLPNYPFPENAARALGRLAKYSEWRRQPEGVIPDFEDIDPREAQRVCRSAAGRGGPCWLSAEETRAVLAALRLPLSPGAIARDAEEAERVAAEIGFPVALKLASRTIVHKTEVGGVYLNLRDAPAVRAAFDDLRDRLAASKKLDAMDGVLIQPMITGGVEVMIGVSQDPLFGPLLAFGLGGIHVEILKDVCFRLTPITDRDASEMVRAIRGFRLLQGYRGHPPADIAALEELLLRVSRLVEEVPEIAELDLNPVIALPPGRGCLVVDARIRVSA